MSVTRDYAKKSAKKPAKKKTPKKSAASRKKAPKKRSKSTSLDIPWGSASLALGAVIGLGYILWVLNQTPPQPKQSSNQTPSVVNQAEQTNNLKKANEEPQPVEFTFHELLKEKRVKVDGTPPPEAQLENETRYIMQCGSFLKPEQADALKAQIAFTGLVASIQATNEQDGKKWYRVVLGPYNSKRTADEQRSQLQRADINGCRIW